MNTSSNTPDAPGPDPRRFPIEHAVPADVEMLTLEELRDLLGAIRQLSPPTQRLLSHLTEQAAEHLRREDRVGAAREGLRALEASLALWAVRDDAAGWETTAAVARTAASEAVTGIDRVLRALHDLRSELVTEIRQFDDATAASTDALLERLRRETGITPLPDDPEQH